MLSVEVELSPKDVEKEDRYYLNLWNKERNSEGHRDYRRELFAVRYVGDTRVTLNGRERGHYRIPKALFTDWFPEMKGTKCTIRIG